MQPLLVDGNNLVRRNINASAMDDLRAGKLWTGGIYGAMSSLGSIAAKLEHLDREPAGIIMFFDSGWSPERARLLPGYKSERAVRKEMMSEEDMAKAHEQMAACRELFPLLGVQVMSFEQREADDCIGGMVSLFVDQGVTPIVLSGDKDLFQTVGMGADVWYLNQDPFILTKDNFHEKVGIDWPLFLLYKALMGDSSDSIKGAPGVGETRAREVLQDACLWVSEGSNGLFEFRDYDTHQQLDELVKLLSSSKEKGRPKFKQAIIDHAERLHDVIDGIRLDNSFGPLEPLDALFTGDHEVTPYDHPAAMEYMAKLNFRSVAMNPRTYLSPYERAYDRFASAFQE